jgi:poly-gamma-glutamate capsule biosynthesis protein CapA/YwtB (metallophosphatase superfamily)
MPDHVVLCLAGDVMTGRGIDQVLQHPGAPGLHEGYVRDARDYVRLAEAVNGPIPAPVAPDYIWGDALAEIERIGPQLRIVNLETAVTRSERAWRGKAIHYRMHPDNVDCLRAARIDCCVLSNNHVLDWGRAGLDETLDTLRQAGLRTAGAGGNAGEAWSPAALPLAPHGRLLVFGCADASSGVPHDWAAAAGRSGVALLDDLSEASARQLAQAIARERKAGDLVLVSIHWGGNWGLAIAPAHRAFARQLVDLGAADVVHGHSSHHPLPVEIYRDRLILYGCGDLINDYEGIGEHGSLRSDLGCLYFATLSLATGALQGLEIVALQLRRFRLGPADAQARRWLAGIFNTEGRTLLAASA